MNKKTNAKGTPAVRSMRLLAAWEHASKAHNRLCNSKGYLDMRMRERQLRNVRDEAFSMLMRDLESKLKAANDRTERRGAAAADDQMQTGAESAAPRSLQ